MYDQAAVVNDQLPPDSVLQEKWSTAPTMTLVASPTNLKTHQ